MIFGNLQCDGDKNEGGGLKMGGITRVHCIFLYQLKY